jgi:hypothetical protein
MAWSEVNVWGWICALSFVLLYNATVLAIAVASYHLLRPLAKRSVAAERSAYVVLMYTCATELQQQVQFLSAKIQSLSKDDVLPTLSLTGRDCLIRSRWRRGSQLRDRTLISLRTAALCSYSGDGWSWLSELLRGLLSQGESFSGRRLWPCLRAKSTLTRTGSQKPLRRLGRGGVVCWQHETLPAVSRLAQLLRSLLDPRPSEPMRLRSFFPARSLSWVIVHPRQPRASVLATLITRME